MVAPAEVLLTQDRRLRGGKGPVTLGAPPGFPGPTRKSGYGKGLRGGVQTPDILSRWPEMIFKPHKSWSRRDGCTTPTPSTWSGVRTWLDQYR